MGGLSNTNIYTASLTRTADAAGDIVTSTVSGAPWGRALSDVAHGSGAGLRYFEVEVISVNSTLYRALVGIVDNTSNLDVNIGNGTERGFMWGFDNSLFRLVSGSGELILGNSAGDVGMRALVWVDCASRKMWITATDFRTTNEPSMENTRRGFPALGTNESWTIPGTGDLRVALSPLAGSPGTPTALRFCSRHSQLRVRGADLLGALPWDARSVTLVEEVSGVADGTVLRYAWFDESRPHLLSRPTTQGSVTKTAGQVSVTISTSLDSGGIGSLLLSNTDGTVIQCRSHYAPAAVS